MLRVLCASIALVCCACRSSLPGSSSEREYVLVILRSGPRTAEYSADQRREIQAQHMANIQRLAGEHVLFVAGPFGQPNPDPSRRGLFVFDVEDVERARDLASTDPAVQAGVLELEMIPIATSADFAGAHQRDMTFMQANLDAGKDAGAGFKMHNYAFAFVAGGKRAASALESAVAPGGVLAVARCGGAHAGSSVVWIDAANVAEAEQDLAPIRGELGALDLTPWFGSASLLELAGTPAR